MVSYKKRVYYSAPSSLFLSRELTNHNNLLGVKIIPKTPSIYENKLGVQITLRGGNFFGKKRRPPAVESTPIADYPLYLMVVLAQYGKNFYSLSPLPGPFDGQSVLNTIMISEYK